MRSVQRTAQFRRDFRRVKRGAHGSHLDRTLLAALELPVADAPLPVRYADHAMKGLMASPFTRLRLAQRELALGMR